MTHNRVIFTQAMARSKKNRFSDDHLKNILSYKIDAICRFAGAAPAKRYDWVCHHSKSHKTIKSDILLLCGE